jgi:hypothetical protein
VADARAMIRTIDVDRAATDDTAEYRDFRARVRELGSRGRVQDPSATPADPGRR